MPIASAKNRGKRATAAGAVNTTSITLFADIRRRSSRDNVSARTGLKNAPHRCDHSVDRSFRQSRVYRQTDHFAVRPCSARIILRPQLVAIAPIWMKMQRNVMNAGADSRLAHQFDKPIAVNRQPAQVEPDHIQVPGVHVARRCARRRSQRQICKSRPVPRCNSLPRLPKSFRLLKLDEANGCSEIRHIVLVAWGNYLVVPGGLPGVKPVKRVTADTVQAHHSHPLSQLRTPRDDHPALSGRDRLVRIEAEDRDVVIRTAHHPSAAGGRQRMSRIRHYAAAVTFRQSADPRHVTGESTVVRSEEHTSELQSQDRKSTRLNSSHSQISYAVFCLKKKKKNHNIFTLKKKPQKTKR